MSHIRVPGTPRSASIQRAESACRATHSRGVTLQARSHGGVATHQIPAALAWISWIKAGELEIRLNPITRRMPRASHNSHMASEDRQKRRRVVAVSPVTS